MIDSRAFPEIRAGDTDSSPALRKLLQQGAGDTIVLQPGVYHLGSGVHIYSGTRLQAAGAVFRASAALDPSDCLLGNVNAGGPIGAYPDTDITIDGLDLDGADLPRTQALLYLIQTKDCLLADLLVHHSRYMGVAIANGRDNTILRGDFHHCGNPVPSPEGGPAIWIGCTSANGTYGTRVMGTTVHECNWSAVYNSGGPDNPVVGTQLIGMVTDDTGESAVFSNLWATDLTVRGCNIGRTHMVTCAANNLEIGGPRTTIMGNTLAGSATAAINFVDTIGAEVKYNFIVNPLENGICMQSRPDYQTATALDFRRNWFVIDRSDTPSKAVGIRLWGDPTLPFTNLKFNRNTVEGPWLSSSNIGPGLWGAGCSMWDNVGLPNKN